MKKTALVLLLFFLTASNLIASEVEFSPIVYNPEIRIKELVSIVGVRPNVLTGVGIVIGLNGTGDSKVNISSTIIANTLAKLGLNVDSGDLKSRNLAVVSVNAILPAFAREGDKIDVLVASIGDAKNLQGGYLTLTQLIAGDEVYALAQGAISTGGFAAESGGSTSSKNATVTARIPNGAIVEQSIDLDYNFGDKITLSLHSKDFTTAGRIAYVINHELGEVAYAKDSGTVEVLLNEDQKTDPVALISRIENLRVVPDSVAKIVINERTGTVVFGSGVKIGAVAISQGGLKVEIASEKQVSQPAPWSEGQTVIVEQTKVETKEEKANSFELKPTTSVGELVDALNMIGASPRDIISILQAMKEAGALHGVLEIM